MKSSNDKVIPIILRFSSNVRLLILLLSLTVFVFSCSKTDNITGDIEGNYSLVLDTLRVESNNYLASTAMRLSQIKNDTLFYFDDQQSKLMSIDLIKNEFINASPITRAEPNGIGNNLWRLDLSTDNKFIFTSLNEATFFDENGEFIKSKTLLDENYLKKIGKDYINITTHCTLADNDQYYCIYDSLQYRNKGFIKFNLRNEEFEITPLKNLSSYNRFDLPKMKFRPLIQSYNGKILFSHPGTNELLIWDVKEGKYEHKAFQSTLTKNSLSFEGVNPENVLELLKSVRSQVHFLKLLYDKERNEYIRLSIAPLNAENKADENSIVVTVFDKDFNQKTELETRLYDNADNHLFHNGKIYIPQYYPDENIYFLTIEVQQH
tara:strand:+ start:1476 stop:2609 length:1134 start_codon:yes stop_codon:yes gene_type:complete